VADIAPLYTEIKSIAERQSIADSKLLFRADLKPLGFKVYFIKKLFYRQPKKRNPSFNKKRDLIQIKNEFLQLDFDSSGNLVQITNIEKNLTTKLSQSYCYYKSHTENNSAPQFQASGAYVFRPRDNKPTCFEQVRNYSIYSGIQFTEIHQIFNEWMSQTIRLYD
jgi:lysosomal alpha-mannosidase